MPYKDPEKRKEFAKAYREKNRDKLNEASRQYHHEHRERRLEEMKEYRDVNKERINEMSRRYYQENKAVIRERMKEYNKEYYEKNREQLLVLNREYARKHRGRLAENLKKNRKLRAEWLLELKSGLQCMRCGESDPVCLEFHHREPSKKENNVSKLVNQAASWERIVMEIDKCVVFCSNCHRKFHAGRFIIDSEL